MIGKPVLIASTLWLASAVATPALAQSRFHLRSVHTNAEGGVSAVRAGGFRNAQAAGVHGRRTVSDGQGNARTVSGGAVQGANGGSAARAGQTVRYSDGSAYHQSGFGSTGPNGGSIDSQGSATRNADGTGSFSRNTQANGASGGHYSGTTSGGSGNGITHSSQAVGADGNSYQGQTTVSRDGVQHSGTCYDAAGNVIGCR